MLKTIKNLFSLVLLLVIFSAQSQLSDKVIAVVDDDVILQSEFDARMASVREQIATGALPRGITLEEIETQLLDQLIIENFI